MTVFAVIDEKYELCNRDEGACVCCGWNMLSMNCAKFVDQFAINCTKCVDSISCDQFVMDCVNLFIKLVKISL